MITASVMFSQLTLVSIQYCNTPYIWGGSKPLTGLDCSGLVFNILKDLQAYDGPRTTSHGFFEWAKKQTEFLSANPCHGCLLFFGKPERINHVAIALDDKYMIESGGGDSRTKTRKDAETRNARVRIARINRRRDLVASIKFYGL